MTREEAIDALRNLYDRCVWANECEYFGCDKCEESLDMAIEALTISNCDNIQSCPNYIGTEDLSELSILKCKDCRYLNRKVQLAPKYYLCTKHTNNHAVQLDDYCSWGERRE